MIASRRTWFLPAISILAALMLSVVPLPEAVAAIGLVETTHVEAEGVCRACSSQREEA